MKFTTKEYCRHTLTTALIAAMALACYRLAQSFVTFLIIELQGAVHEDFLLYTIIGKGMNNGWKPYIDLYETKPPGMYLLNMASLAITGNEWPLKIMLIACSILLPLSIAIYAFRHQKGTGIYERIPLCLGALGMMMLLIIYLEQRSGGMQSETFGAFFSIAYATTFFWKKKTENNMKLMAVRAMLLVCSIGIKEPFFLINLAIGILLAKERREFFRSWVLPMVLAAATGLTLLLLLDLHQEYFSVYLPSMILRSHTGTDPHEPMLLRLLAIRRLYADTTHFFAAYGFGGILLTMFAVSPLLNSNNMKIKKGVLMTIGILLGVYLTWWGYHFGYLLPLQDLLNQEMQGVFYKVERRMIISAALFLCVLLYVGRDATGKVISTLFALHLTSLAVGMGGTYNMYHFSFAVPIYFTVIIIWIRSIEDHPQCKRMLCNAFLVLVSLAALTFNPDTKAESYLRDKVQYGSGANFALVQAFDRVMQECDSTRYYSLSHSAQLKLAFSQHSPIGPLFSDIFPHIPKDHALQHATEINRNSSAIIVMNADDTDLPETLQEQYSERPTCITNADNIKGIRMFFRKSQFTFNKESLHASPTE